MGDACKWLMFIFMVNSHPEILASLVFFVEGTGYGKSYDHPAASGGIVTTNKFGSKICEFSSHHGTPSRVSFLWLPSKSPARKLRL